MNLNGLVTRIRMSADRPNNILMETVVCDQCGQRFAIHHDPARQNVDVARKQASWVKDKLVWDHIQERKHNGTLELPWLQ
ncbi:MAG TPA: hypothetical protein VI685_22285 [Candidatus Angelobacter sp.]